MPIGISPRAQAAQDRFYAQMWHVPVAAVHNPGACASYKASSAVWHDSNNLGSFGFQQKYGTSNVSAVAADRGYKAFMSTICRR